MATETPIDLCSAVECRTPEREVRGSRPTAAVMCPWARHFTPRKYWLITQEAMLLWIQISSNLQEMRTGIKSRTGLNFGRIWLVILELPALQRWKKWCLQLFSVTFDWVFVKLAGNEDRHKSSNKFEFGSDRIIHFGVICPWAPIFTF